MIGGIMFAVGVAVGYIWALYDVRRAAIGAGHTHEELMRFLGKGAR